MIRRRPKNGSEGLDKLVAETQELVNQLLKENRALKSRNQKLSREIVRISAGWDAIKQLARSAPRRARAQSRGR